MRKTQYTPGTPEGPEALALELERVNNALESPFVVEVLEKLTQEPGRKRNGMLVYADGTSWNPGSGEGIYAYIGGTWTKLG